ncbi:hypothetical protein Thiosp_04266 [Thiorhodovibrio litoralis]|nr:hypothetical protein [Thiorhodovibrio winogradskyi]WPL14423.1 hypothetical protein Thiosp_04266 [Thiorhodovibrio litoralis]
MVCLGIAILLFFTSVPLFADSVPLFADRMSGPWQRGHFIYPFVVNLPYQCGKRKGRTDGEGGFYFRRGQQCTFLIGELELKLDTISRNPGGLEVIGKYISVHDFTETEEEAAALYAILETVSVFGAERLYVVDELAEQVQNVDLDVGDPSVNLAFSGHFDPPNLTSVARAERHLDRHFHEDGTFVRDFRLTLVQLPKGVKSEDMVLDFLGDTAKEYLSSQVLDTLGLGDDTSEKLAELSTQLENLNSEIQTVIQDDKKLLGDFAKLFNYLDATKQAAYNALFTDITTDIGNYQKEYNNILSGQTLEQTLTNSDNCSALEDLMQGILPAATDPTVANDLPILAAAPVIRDQILAAALDFQSTKADNSKPLAQLFVAAQQHLSTKLPKVGSVSSDETSALLDQYNEGAMNQLAQAVSILQSLYLFEHTALYIRSPDTGVSDDCKKNFSLTLAEQNMDETKSFAKNLVTLQGYYNSVGKLKMGVSGVLDNFFNSVLISDAIWGHTSPKSSAYETHWISAVKMEIEQATAQDWINMPSGDWVDNCKVYQWYGFTDFPESDRFPNASFDGTSLEYVHCRLDPSKDIYYGSSVFDDWCVDLIGNGLTVSQGQVTCGGSDPNGRYKLMDPVPGQYDFRTHNNDRGLIAFNAPITYWGDPESATFTILDQGNMFLWRSDTEFYVADPGDSGDSYHTGVLQFAVTANGRKSTTFSRAVIAYEYKDLGITSYWLQCLPDDASCRNLGGKHDDPDVGGDSMICVGSSDSITLDPCGKSGGLKHFCVDYHPDSC